MSTLNVDAILQYLGLTAADPNHQFLTELMHAYIHTVPWESASRNVRRERVNAFQLRPNWPATFWESAIARGTGGTCFESNYAFLTLLNRLGYEGYLTINDMESHRAGCHTAIIVPLADKRYLVDVGYPLHMPLEIDPTRTTKESSRFLDFFVKPVDKARYHIMRERHPHPYIFTLMDNPITEERYRVATAIDYLPEGNFNNRVVINKIVDGSMYRFNSHDDGQPSIETFTPIDETQNRKEMLPIEDDLPTQLHKLFGIDREILAQGLAAVEI